MDGHIDLPHRLRSSSENGQLTEDVSQRTAAGHFDYERARAGGLDAPFLSIYVPPSYQTSGGARGLADQLIDLVEQLARAHPQRFALATTPEQVRQNTLAGKVSLPLGIENGAALERDLGNVAHFRERGVSYITLTHSRDNAIGDSSYEDRHTHHGLSPFGVEVVREMNRTGILVDVSHVSDETFSDVLEHSRVPVIASHSSLRYFVPGFKRNLSDDMVRALGKNGGVVMINFGSEFLLPKANQVVLERWAAGKVFAEQNQLNRDIPEQRRRIEAHAEQSISMPYASVSDVAEHIDRVKRLAGVDHVGLGSDFDGLGDSLPRGLEDVSQYPNLLRELLARGYSEAELEKICSSNLFRVWQTALDFAQKQAEPAPPTAKDSDPSGE